MIKKDPNERVSSQDAANDPWFVNKLQEVKKNFNEAFENKENAI